MSKNQRVHQKSSPTNSGDSVDSHLPKIWAIATIYLGLALTTLVIYWPLSQSDFVNWDDDAFVYQNPHVVGGLSAENFRWSLEIHGPGQWHPLSYWAFQLNCQLFGVQPGAHHMVSVALHVIASLLLLTVLWRISRAFWPSALVAALHALHPLSVESVAWIAHLRDPLSLLFWLLVMWAYCAYARRGGISRYLLVVLLMTLGLMAKPTLITLPCVLLLLDWWPLNRVRFGAHSKSGNNVDPENNEATPVHRSPARLAAEKIPLLALSMTSAYLAYLCQRSMGVVVSLETHSWGARLANAAQSYVLYLRNMVWPLNLAPYYPLPDGFEAPLVLGSLFLLVGITVTAVYFRQRAPHLIVGWLWYLGTLVPVIGILKMGAMTAMTDHYMYISLLGIYIAIAWQLAMWVEQRPNIKFIVFGFVVLTLIGLVSLSSRQVAIWRNSEALWKHTLAVAGESNSAHNNLGATLLASGRAQEALGHFQDAARLAPNNWETHNNSGNALTVLGRQDEAVAFYRKAAALAPANPEVQYNWGVALQKQQRWDEAITRYQEALRIKPQFRDPHTNWGVCLRALGDSQAAIKHFQQALQIDSDSVRAHIELGITLNSLGRKAEAIEEFELVLRIDPNDFPANYHGAVALLAVGRRAEALKGFEKSLTLRPNNGGVHFGLAWIMATAPEDELRDGKRAIEHARRAVVINKGNPFMLEALAAAHAEAKEFAEAIKWQEQATKMVTGKRKIEFQARLAQYRKQLPYRLPK